jgi:dihydroorotate dehydrogenase subfamily 1
MAPDINVSLVGVGLETPLVVSAGPLTRDVRSIERLAAAGGVGAVVLKTIYRQPAETPRPYMAKVSRNLLNYDWSAPGVEEWTPERFERLRACGLPIIASVLDKDDEVLVEMARTMQERGAAIIEVPSGSLPSAERVLERTAKLRSELTVPLIVKIGSTVPKLDAWVGAIEDAGADGITAINTIGPALAIDAETGKPLLGNTRGHGYLSGPALLPISLRVVADIVAYTDLPVMGVGGVDTATSAVQMLMVGAQAIQIHTAGILKGLGVFQKIASGLTQYLDSHGHSSLAAIRRVSQQYLTPERSWDVFTPHLERELCNHCALCERVCVYEAVTMQERLPLFAAAHCHSCGLCISACPTGALSRGGQ